MACDSAFFVYTGDHPVTETLDHRFVAGVPTEVRDPYAIGKLRGNSHFVETPVIENAPVKRKPGRPRKVK